MAERLAFEMSDIHSEEHELGAFRLLFTIISEHIIADHEDYGTDLTAILNHLAPGARSVIARVRHYVLEPDRGLQQAKAFKDSYSPTLAMIGVASAHHCPNSSDSPVAP
ncbi:hypothetical protein LTR78_005493 [Recurvomyces mirabilis]|uniref:Uncharacterized protein n=1 Tax=Recurvomyces mirabilis TaxID=574656 RepID=A0AAE1C1H1_9PEZI|nr:hypothetical protein LTR78_005493 [Recurvomyces mirabilis]KAK5152598.1 hypothetical protein LTS14_008132 [Recurvomyces mirabilis]